MATYKIPLLTTVCLDCELNLAFGFQFTAPFRAKPPIKPSEAARRKGYRHPYNWTIKYNRTGCQKFVVLQTSYENALISLRGVMLI